jgi:hypothetical protein
MKKKVSKKMVVLIVVLSIFALIVIWFLIPYSPMKNTFKKDIRSIKKENHIEETGAFRAEDFIDLPKPIQKYVESCGYIGKPKMNWVCMEYEDVDFKQGKSGPSLKIDYTQYDFASSPCRMAFIDSSMFGVPFEGYDYYRDGKGGMKGVIGKLITIFHQTGPEMDKACLATYLAESLFAPSILLQDFITFEEIDDYHVKATITYGGQTASGVFTFNDKYEYTSFTTNDRAVSNSDGTMEYVPWTASCGEYKEAENGIKYPTTFSATWNYPDGDFTYFDGEIKEVTYNV